MRPEGCEAELLRALASMPFLDRLEMVAVTGWSRGPVYEAAAKLESEGFCASALHATDILPPARRFHLTAAGLRRLADEEDVPPDELARSRPVSAQWRRNLMERMDALAAVYHVASVVSNVEYPIAFRWYRAMPMDAAMTLPDGRTIGVVRQGLTADRSGFAKRIWRMRDEPMPGVVLMLMADDVRLRHARRLLSTTQVPALFAVEREAALAKPGDRIWSPSAVSASLDLRYVLDRLSPGGELPVEREPQRADFPADVAIEGPEWDISDPMLPFMLKAAEKRALDIIADWPWIALGDLAGLLGVSPQRASQLVNPLEGLDLAERPRDAGGRLVAADRGLALLSRRDRTSVGLAKKRWSAALEDADAPLDWRNVSGSRSRQLLRNTEHTAAVHGFLAALTAQAPCWGGRSSSSTRPGGRRGISGTRAGCEPSTPTPSASCARAMRPGPSSWSGSEGPCAPQPCRSDSPPICATTHPTDPPTTTARGPRSWSSSITRSHRPTSCAWRGRRCGRRARRCPCGCPTGRLSTPWGHWDAPGAPPATGSRPRPRRPYERR